LSAGCAGREAPAQLTLASGPAGSAHEACGRAIADLLRDRAATVMVTAGSVESLQALGSGRAELALTTVDTLARAVNGERPFAGNTVSARTLATIYTSRLHLVVPASSGIHGFSQVRNHGVGLGTPESGTDLTAMRALSVALLDTRVSARPVTFLEGLAEISDGRLGAFFWLDGVPSPALERAVVDRGARLRLLNNASVVTLLQRRYGTTLYEPAEIPAGVYGMAERTDAVGVPTVLVSRHDLPEGVGYSITRTLFDRISQLVAACPAARGLNASFAAGSSPAALESGAARFYRESGIHSR
jgi:TRAP transporter TAXI family solute receptor